MAKQMIYALFQTVADAERAIGALEDRGVAAEDIGVVSRRASEVGESDTVHAGLERVSDGEQVRELDPRVEYRIVASSPNPEVLDATATPTSPVDTVGNVETVGKSGITTTTAQDAGAGAAIGTGAGLFAGLVAAAVSLTVPGFGIILAGGALAAAATAALATTAAGAAVGGVTGYLRDMGMGHAASTVYHDRIVEGDYLVSVAVNGTDYDEVKRLLTKYNAAGVDVTAGVDGAVETQLWGARPEVVPHFERALTIDQEARSETIGRTSREAMGEPLIIETHTSNVTVADSERALADIPEDDLQHRPHNLAG